MSASTAAGVARAPIPAYSSVAMSRSPRLRLPPLPLRQRPHSPHALLRLSGGGRFGCCLHDGRGGGQRLPIGSLLRTRSGGRGGQRRRRARPDRADGSDAGRTRRTPSRTWGTRRRRLRCRAGPAGALRPAMSGPVTGGSGVGAAARARRRADCARCDGPGGWRCAWLRGSLRRCGGAEHPRPAGCRRRAGCAAGQAAMGTMAPTLRGAE